MSWLGVILVSPVAGEVQLFDDMVIDRASACDFNDSGICIPI
jgi:hypothetical protein